MHLAEAFPCSKPDGNGQKCRKTGSFGSRHFKKKNMGVLELKKSSPGASLYYEEMMRRWT
jgi:hypothetical protein